jgi:hypothetical protein
MADERDIPHFNKMANESKQTAVEWLQSEIDNKDMGEIPMWIYEFIEQSKEIEKEQIIDAWEDGQSELSLKDKQEYYNETFGK